MAESITTNKRALSTHRCADNLCFFALLLLRLVDANWNGKAKDGSLDSGCGRRRDSRPRMTKKIRTLTWQRSATTARPLVSVADLPMARSTLSLRCAVLCRLLGEHVGGLLDGAAVGDIPAPCRPLPILPSAGKLASHASLDRPDRGPWPMGPLPQPRAGRGNPTDTRNRTVENGE